MIRYLGLLFIIDLSGIMDLYGQNFYRRIINMYRRTDQLSYKKLEPFCYPIEKMISYEDVQKLQSIKIPDKFDLQVYSRKKTITHQCCDKFSLEEKQIITDISEKVRQEYEILINKKLYYLNARPTIYSYRGKKSQHLWHVDPNNVNTIYNVIVCFKRIGGISPLQCKDGAKINSIHFEEGDAAIFRGGTTIHQVPPNNDTNSERTVLSIAFTSDRNYTKVENMCTYTEGGSNYVNIFKLFISIFFINFILSYLSDIHLVPYRHILVFFILGLLISTYVPFLNTGLGSGRSSSIHKNILLGGCTMCVTCSTKGGILFFTYFMLSDVFFMRRWVEYD
jgi:hypothetical protein